MNRFLTLTAFAVCSFPLHASGPLKVPWQKLCQIAGSRQLVMTTTGGETVAGYCTRINADEIAVVYGPKLITVPRPTLVRIEMHRSRKNHLRSLGRGIRVGLKKGTGWLFSPYAPAGMIALPVTLAWGAVVAPFCLLGDLGDRRDLIQEVHLI